MRQAVHHRCLLGHANWVMLERQNHHPSPKAEAFCLACRCCCHQQTIRYQRIAREMVLGEPATPVAQLFQQPYLCQLLLVALLARKVLTAITEHKMRKVHGHTPFYARDTLSKSVSNEPGHQRSKLCTAINIFSTQRQ